MKSVIGEVEIGEMTLKTNNIIENAIAASNFLDISSEFKGSFIWS